MINLLQLYDQNFLLNNGSGALRRTGDLNESDVWSRHCVAGGISAAISRTVLAPLDRIRMHMQVTDSGCFREVVRHVYYCQGIRGFWRGNLLNVLKSSPEFAIKFSVYDYVKQNMLKRYPGDGHANGRDRFVAGAVAGVCGQTILYPLETIKTRLIIGKYMNTMDVVIKTYKNGGVSAFFKGFWPSTLSIFLFTGIELMTYEHMKHWQFDRIDKTTGDNSPVLRHQWTVNMIAALCSSTLGVTICYPVSTIITRLQIEDGPAERTVVGGIKQFVSLTKIRGLYRGYFSSFIKMLPTMSITYVAYEELCTYFGIQMT